MDWAMGYTYPATSGNMSNGDYNGYSPGYIFGGKFISAASPMALPNENITWFKSKTFDVGFDFEAWNGLLGVFVRLFLIVCVLAVSLAVPVICLRW